MKSTTSSGRNMAAPKNYAPNESDLFAFFDPRMLKLNPRHYYILLTAFSVTTVKSNMSLDNKQPKSFLTIGLEILDLEYRRKNGSSKFAAKYFADLDVEIKSAKTMQSTTPRRNQDDILSDLEKYNVEHAALMARRTQILGPRMTDDEWIHDSGDSTGFWTYTAESLQMNSLKNKIEILNNELTRPR